MIVRQLAFILFLFAAAGATAAEETNYYDPRLANYHCVVCGKGPLNGQVWTHPRGVICDECEKIKERCLICGVPVKAGDGHIKTADGRLICKFDKTNAVLTLDQAKALFEQTRDDVVDLYGRQFALKSTDVAVNLFDVDYWSEKGRTNDLHTFGFAHSRKTADGRCTHAVIMLSGRTREEMISVAAHEYTHLWINENRPDSHVIDDDTIEAVCELTACKLMGQKKLTGMQQRILENPYTNGKIKALVAAEREGGTDYILNWVKTGTTATLETESSALAAPVRRPALTFTNVPAPLPTTLKLGGLLVDGQSRHAIVSGVSFGAGETKAVKLQGRTVQVRCREIRRDEVVLEVDGLATPVRLKIGEEKFLP